MSCYALYKVLECSENASYEDLKRSYRRLILRHHPDKAQAGENTDEFRRIEEAWSTLRDPQSRKKYDAECRQAKLESQSSPIWATIRVEDMNVSQDRETLTYRCRCGSDYAIDRLEVAEENCTFHVPCQDCTFVVAVET